MDRQRLLSYVRRAVDDYRMIQDGDLVAASVSGGKDSITLALALKGLERFYPKKFSVRAYTVDLGFGADYDPLKRLFEANDLPYTIIPTRIKEIVFDCRKEANPCALCASLRKGAMNDQLSRDGINKVALGHHKEDVINTFLLSLLYEGRINTFQPVTELSRSHLTVIRPMIYVSEGEIIHFSNKNELPIINNPCPVNGITKRGEMEDLLKQLKKVDYEIPTRIFSAIRYSDLPGWHSDFVPNRGPLHTGDN